MDRPLWEPSRERREGSQMAAFMRRIDERYGLSRESYDALHRFSVEQPERFWTEIWDYCDLKASERGERVIVDGHRMPGARFFPDAKLNYAENALWRDDDGPAIIFRGEDKMRASMSWRTLNDKAARMQQALAALKVEAGDRVAAVMPNMPDTTYAFLGSVALGAIWSSCSPDFGERGILDRFGQIEPAVLVCCDGYYYNGKRFLIGEKLASVVRQLPTVRKVVVIDYLGEAEAIAKSLPNAVVMEDFLSAHPGGKPEFAQLPFSHPLYILYSSGTTGVPKCIVHSAGGALIKHKPEHMLHVDVRQGDRVFYFTTCGWMMWNWVTSALLCGATVMQFDGSPFAPSERVLFDFADEEGMTVFGTSAKFVDAVRKTGWRPVETHKLTSLRTMLSTGSPLAPESFDFVYTSIKKDIHLGSISGGTDLCGCFVASNPMLPVWKGEIQCAVLGMAVEVFNEDGKPLPEGKGELVCTKPFPSMPVMFWNDPHGEKYHNAYFERFPNTWCHGDFAEWTEHGGMIIHGRSDATLNPGGVRIGTSEIYAEVEQIPEVVEAIAIGQPWEGDTRIILFVRLQEGVVLDDALIDRIRRKIRDGASPRHVPAKVIGIADIPRTKSGKITELAVRDIIMGREVKNKEALANPEALELFRNRPELRT